MFGTFRLALSLMVVWHHLIDRDHTAFAGPVAVFGFYCLSGFLMTKVVNETYRDGVPGFARYLANRALRIYPAYFAALMFGAMVLLLWPEAAAQVSTRFAWPADILPSLTIIGLNIVDPIIVGPAWSLHVELLHYIAIGAILGRSRMATVGWFVFAAQIVMLTPIIRPDLPVEWYYYHVAPASLPFAVGAVIYHFRDHLPRLRLQWGILFSAALVTLAILMPRTVGWSGGLYAGLAISAAAVVALKDLPQPAWDARLGDMAYPVFLFHMAAGAAAVAAIGPSDATIPAAITLTFLLSAAVIIVIEQPMRRIRGSLRRPSFGRLIPPTSSRSRHQHLTDWTK